jgi:hypothetical protein
MPWWAAVACCAPAVLLCVFGRRLMEWVEWRRFLAGHSDPEEGR